MMKTRMTTKVMLYYFKEQARLKYIHIFTCSRKKTFSHLLTAQWILQ